MSSGGSATTRPVCWRIRRPGAESLCGEHASRCRSGLRKLLIQESLRHGLISSGRPSSRPVPEGSRQAGRSKRGRRHALPAGWSERFVGAAMICTRRRGRRAGHSPALVERGIGDLIRGRLRRPPCLPQPAVLTGGLASPSWGPACLRRPTGSRALSHRHRRAATAKAAVLFSGVPHFADGQAVLFDSAGGDDKLPDTGTSRISRSVSPWGPEPGSLDPGLSLLIFVDGTLPSREPASAWRT